MCTVTFIPANNSYFFTSNRDEKNSRVQAVPPLMYRHQNGNLFYPKDAEAGGTWILLKETGPAAVLLNGAFENHIPQQPYRKSRGLILLDLLKTASPSRTVHSLSLDHIEPFTLVLLENQQLFEFRWDGNLLHEKSLDIKRPAIWSSPTLYNKQARSLRESLFASFLSNTPQPTQQDILNFHQLTNHNNPEASLIKQQPGPVSTISICSIMLTENRGSMKYLDLKTKIQSEVKTELTEVFDLS